MKIEDKPYSEKKCVDIISRKLMGLIKYLGFYADPICRVCRKPIKIRTGTLFCSGKCLKEFGNDPEKYFPTGEFSGSNLKNV